jgi:hypothetical protein
MSASDGPAAYDEDDMKKLTSWTAAAALTLAACGASEDPAQKYRDAMPKAAAVQVGTPDSDQTAANALVSSSASLVDGTAPKSEYAVMSYYLALTLNGGVGWTLTFVQFVTAFPPTSCDDASCTWGPWVDDHGLNRWKLTVQKVDGAYEYVLAGQRGSDTASPWASLIAGTAYPVDRAHGSGAFTIDFDAEATLEHGPLWEQKDFGRLDVTYDNTRDASITAEFVGARNSDPLDRHFLNAAYSFQDAASGGTLQIAFENLDTTEVVKLRTRWSAGGAGRGDVVYDPDGAGAADPVKASECWAGAAQEYAEVYDSKDFPQLRDESACSPFASAVDATIALPE